MTVQSGNERNKAMVDAFYRHRARPGPLITMNAHSHHTAPARCIEADGVASPAGALAMARAPQLSTSPPPTRSAPGEHP